MKKLQKLVAAAFIFAAASALHAKEFPALDGDSVLVVDSYEIRDRGGSRFTSMIKVYDYASDGEIQAQIFGYGGNEGNRWADLGTVSLEGFGDEPKLKGSSADYLRYQYYGIKIISPSTRKFQITSNQLNKNLNFYIWEADADVNAAPLPSMKNNIRTFVFDAKKLDSEYDDDIYIVNKTGLDALSFTIHGYDKKKHVWFTYASGSVNTGNSKKVKKVSKKLDLDDFRYFAVQEVNTDEDFTYEIVSSKKDINIVVTLSGK
ncbi:MAG: hypothetical protein K6G00_02230 [Treponema sp.]|nr:hypothetical protein [Treponema sp.]